MIADCAMAVRCEEATLVPLRITSKGGEIVWSGSIFPGYLKSRKRTFSIFLKVVTRMPNKMNQAASAALKLYSKVPNLHNEKRRQF